MRAERILPVLLLFALALVVFSGTALAKDHALGTVPAVVDSAWLQAQYTDGVLNDGEFYDGGTQDFFPPPA